MGFRGLLLGAALVHLVAGAAAVPGLRLEVTQSGGLLDPSTGKAFRARGLNWGRRTLGLYNSTDPATMQSLLGPDANHVRLVIDWYSDGHCATDSFSAAAGASGGWLAPEWLEYIDDAVNWTTGAGVWFTLTMRNNVGTNSPHGGPSTPCAADYISNATLRKMWGETWSFLARRYLHVDRVAWYEPASEPHLREAFSEAKCGHSNADVMAMLGDAVSAIREVDSNTLVAVSPEYNACPGLSIAKPLINDSKIVYAVNWWCSHTVPYLSTTTCGDVFGEVQAPCVSACAAYNKTVNPTVVYNASTLHDLFASARDFARANSLPVWVDQLGCPADTGPTALQFVRDSFAMFDDLGASWSWWTLRGANISHDMGLLQPTSHAAKSDVGHYYVDNATLQLLQEGFRQ